MVKVSEMLDEMITAREALVADAVAARDCAREFRTSDTMNGRLMALQVGEARKVCRGGTRGDIASPGPDGLVSVGR